MLDADSSTNDSCSSATREALSLWETSLTIITLTLIIVVTIIGNVLVILSVFTYKPLRIVQNFFIVSLAVADLTVAILVLPFNIIYWILGHWIFGMHVCKLWLTSDVLCCTASILNLCAIALDRFWAITDPINYAQKRTLKRVLLMIAAVWILSLLISSPPLIGWNDWPEPSDFNQECKLSTRQGYVIYSSLGSFYIPLFIMTLVYLEIFIATRRRLRERAQASKIGALQNQCVITHKEPNHDGSLSSEANQNEKPDLDKVTKVNITDSKVIEEIADDAEESTAALGEIKMQSKVQLKRGDKCDVVCQFIEEKQRISLNKERRAARTLGIVMGVFVVCWLPFFVMYVILPFCSKCCPSKRLTNFITWLGYINSVLNPIIYTIFNLDFRCAFRRILSIH